MITKFKFHDAGTDVLLDGVSARYSVSLDDEVVAYFSTEHHAKIFTHTIDMLFAIQGVFDFDHKRPNRIPNYVTEPLRQAISKAIGK